MREHLGVPPHRVRRDVSVVALPAVIKAEKRVETPATRSVGHIEKTLFVNMYQMCTYTEGMAKCYLSISVVRRLYQIYNKGEMSTYIFKNVYSTRRHLQKYKWTSVHENCH